MTGVSSGTSGSQSAGSVWLGGEEQRKAIRPSNEIAGLGMGVTKKDREGLKQNDPKTYYKVRDNAIEGMQNKFSQLKSFDENATMEHLGAVYSIVTRFDDLKAQLVKSNLVNVFTIPSEFVYDDSLMAYVLDSQAVPMDLFVDGNYAELETVKLANAHYMQLGTSFHSENIAWSGDKILNSCDAELRDKLVESIRAWPEEFKGGPTYLKLLQQLVLSTSEKSLRSLTNKLARLTIADFPGEDVTKAVSFIRGAVLILKDNNALPSDIITQVLQIFKKSCCESFRIHVTNIDSLITLKVKSYHLDDLLTDLDKNYIDLLGQNEWTAKSPTVDQQSGFNATPGSDKRKIICFNCGGIFHGVADCPHPRDETAISLCKELMSAFGKPKDSVTKGTRDPYLIPPRRGEPQEKVIDGKFMKWCGKPGCKKWNPDHTTDEHDAHNANLVTDDSATVPPAPVSSIGDDTATTTSSPTDNESGM